MSNAKSLRTRIKSVNSTMHITKAMEIVASSKFKKALNTMEKSRLYYTALRRAVDSLACGRDASVYFENRSINRSCCIVIAGDRGLAGGYNNNVLKQALAYADGKNVCVVPIGKKAMEFFERRDFDIYSKDFPSSERVDDTALMELAEKLSHDFEKGLIDEVQLFHTSYISILSQEAAASRILPVVSKQSDKKVYNFEYEPSAAVVLNMAIPQYIFGALKGLISESFVCELSARRNAMNSANKNAEEMIENLNLEYNRARQSAITQEITEIVAGS